MYELFVFAKTFKSMFIYRTDLPALVVVVLVVVVVGDMERNRIFIIKEEIKTSFQYTEYFSRLYFLAFFHFVRCHVLHRQS